MNFWKKFISVVFITIVAIINVKIVIDYEIIRPTEKYFITEQKKAAAKVLTIDVQPNEKSVDEMTEELKEDKDEEIQEEAKEIEVVISETQIEEQQIPKEIVETSNEAQQPETTSEETVSSNSSDIVETAKSYIGSSYVAGGSSPETGFDCSGFTQYVYGLYGISLNRVSSDQADNGTPISKEELQPGDLLLFTYYGSDSIGHTGIYIGDGKFVHAANSTRGVVTDTIESGYYLENYAGARRVN